MAKGGKVDRRTLLGLGSSAALAAALRGASPARAASAATDEILVAGNFKVEIEGCPRSSAFCTSVAIGRMRTTPDDDRPLAAAPNDAHPQRMRFDACRLTFHTPVVGRNEDLAGWMAASVAGKVDLRRIVVSVLRQDLTVARTYDLVESFPLSFDGGDFTTGGESNLAELCVRPTRVEIA